MKARMAILISGSGTNMVAIAEAVRNSELDAEITFVGSDRENAAGLKKAAALKLDVKFFSYKNGKTTAEEEIAAAVEATNSRWIVLAGYMKIFSPYFVEKFTGRIINIHPSLLPAFQGARAIDDAWEYGVKVTGVTIHLVDEEVDHGKILAQQAIDITEDDTRKSLEEKIHSVEHQLYKATLKTLFETAENKLDCNDVYIDSDTFDELTKDICKED